MIKMGISVEKLMEFYVDTLQKCGTNLLEMSDEDIEYNIFEEFDVGAISFLHDDTLSKLKKANLITEEISHKSSVLRSKFMFLQNTDLWNVSSVRNNKSWDEILKLSDEIKSLLNQ
ncbi:hypothetical protein RBH29_13690 [Herbivorax sp. ANBcel31]|uniref:hypothetical protein n=1 Tax=Herbivorax sp. ANBcel31 TaxID=3069754 RepID=UPI0027B83842|nr:hypothetical protein [Herbivorax sp. ANBcel31]MDQ2087479.1 hypothetical protein [Herbivorax sp. ANBcel31]